MEAERRAGVRGLRLLRGMSVAHRVVLVNLLGIAIVTAVLVAVTTVQIRAVTIEKEDQRFVDRYLGFATAIEAERDTALALAMTTAQRLDVQAAFAAQDRPELTRLTLPMWLALDKRFDVPQCQFILPSMTSFLRLHALDTYDDDLGAYRLSIVDAIERREPVGGLEAGWAGLSIRGVAPVWYGRDFAGAVEFGMGFDRAFLTRYAADTGLELEVHLLESVLTGPMKGEGEALAGPEAGLALAPYASTSRDQLPLPADVFAEVVEDESPVIRRLTHEGAHYGVLVGPLYDYSQRIIGVVEIVADRTETVVKMRRGQYIASAAGLAVMVVSGLGSYAITRRMTAPLADISEAARRAAEGSFAEPIPVTMENEVGVLAAAFNHMVANLKELLGQITATSQQVSGSGARLAAEMNQINASIEQIALTVNEMALGAGTQAQRVEEASHAMAMLAEATGQISSNAHRTGEASIRAIRTVEDVRRVVDTLDQRATRIERIVVDVDKIADQTNLLALNASIEAARAGEAGAGFVVVAQEVRRLAVNSTRLVAEIADLSQEIGGDLADILEKMEETQRAVAQTAEIAQETADAAQGQGTSSDAMVAAINEIAAVAEENAASSEEVAVTVEQQASSVERIAVASQSLAELAAQLQETLARFRAS